MQNNEIKQSKIAQLTSQPDLMVLFNLIILKLHLTLYKGVNNPYLWNGHPSLDKLQVFTDFSMGIGSLAGVHTKVFSMNTVDLDKYILRLSGANQQNISDYL